MKRRHRAMTAAAFVAVAIAAAAEAPPPDADFLEFLGSLDTEDEEWRDYLAERPADDARPVEKAKEDRTVHQPAPRPASVDAPSRRSAAKPEQVRKP